MRNHLVENAGATPFSVIEAIKTLKSPNPQKAGRNGIAGFFTNL
jgi:hypothetical protein